ncbi:uncharacterized protein VTP21DRAFT_11168 [Calcarisporiella thermophila]|uniref:uncharacterized protein n=1 Tax=Calcarisporiella thermophila TaxID=911321 RepID=UPI00374293E5
MRPIVALLISSLFTFAYAFDINTVDNSTRALFPTWCTHQKASCENICYENGLTTQANNCDDKTLAYHCICSNGLAPNSSQYTQTIPYFICTTDREDCIRGCKIADATCVAQCHARANCTATEPKKYNRTSTSTIGMGTPSSVNPANNPTSTKPSGIFAQSDSASSGINIGFVVFLSAAVFFFSHF